MRAEHAWRAALGQLQMEMSKAAFDTWVKDVEMIAYEDGEFIVGVGNAYARDWLENRLASMVIRILTGIMNRTVTVRFVMWNNSGLVASVEFEEPAESVREESPCLENLTLNPRYSFNNFVVGASNRLAHAA